MLDRVRELLGQEIEDEPEDEEDESPPTPTLDDEEDEEQDDGSIEGDVEQQLKGLESKVNDIETDTETNHNRVEALQNDIDTVEDELEELEDNVRDLLGIYDAFSARVNPLVEGDIDSFPAASGSREDSDFDLTAGDEEPISVGGEDDDEGNEESEDVRTLSDLKKETLDEEPEQDGSSGDGEQHRVYSFAGTYASEVVAYEWLSMLLHLSGTSGTLRALSYYHDIGWISADVKKALQRRLAGAEFEGDARKHRDLRADDHADSLSYVIKLEELEEQEESR